MSNGSAKGTEDCFAEATSLTLRLYRHGKRKLGDCAGESTTTYERQRLFGWIHLTVMSRTITIVGVMLLLLGMTIDLYQHGIDFLMRKLTEAPWAHGLPIAGITLIILGVMLGRSTRQE